RDLAARLSASRGLGRASLGGGQAGRGAESAGFAVRPLSQVGPVAAPVQRSAGRRAPPTLPRPRCAPPGGSVSGALDAALQGSSPEGRGWPAFDPAPRLPPSARTTGCLHPHAAARLPGLLKRRCTAPVLARAPPAPAGG